MIIKKLLELCLSLLTSLLSNVGNVPALPEQILTIFQTVINYMVSGIDLLGLFIGPTALTFIGVCLDVIIALNLFYFGYSCVMWFVKKIPFLGIKQPFAPDCVSNGGKKLCARTIFIEPLWGVYWPIGQAYLLHLFFLRRCYSGDALSYSHFQDITPLSPATQLTTKSQDYDKRFCSFCSFCRYTKMVYFRLSSFVPRGRGACAVLPSP